MGDSNGSTVEPASREVFRLGEFTVDPSAGEMRGPAGGEQLDPKVMQVLVLLASRAGHVVPRQELLERVWPGTVVSDDALSRCIYQLRRHMTRAGGGHRYKALLETFPKRGYRLNCGPPAAVESSSRAGSPHDPADRDARGHSPRVTAIAAADARRTGVRTWFPIAVAAFLTVALTAVWFLNRLDYFWRNPLANARFTRLTDFEGVEQDAAVSRDGKFVAFLSDRDGPIDAWISQIGTGEFHNLTRGRIPEMRNPAVRTVGFSPDGSGVSFWARVENAAAGSAKINTWVVPSMGGQMRPYLEGVAEVAWSADGTRAVYHTTDPGDPIFVTGPDERFGRQIFAAPPGLHCHFPVWSPDGAYVYFAYGSPPDEMDLWRIPPAGGEPERITFHNSRVAYPVFLDDRTLFYLATADHGAGASLYGMNVERRISHRISFGLAQFTSLAASGDGRRLVATITNRRTGLWRVPILDRLAEDSDAARMRIPTAGGRSPRLGPDYLLYLSPNGSVNDIRKLANGVAIELWSGRQGSVVAGPALDPDGRRIAFPVARGDTTRLYVMNADGADVLPLAEDLAVTGAPAWSPDGRWIAIAADTGSGPQLVKVPADGGSPVSISHDYAIDPVWSPDGQFLVYRGREVGPTFPVKAVNVEGEPYRVPGLILPRGAGRFAFLPASASSSGTTLVVLKGELQRRNFWLVDVHSGDERQITDFGLDFEVGEFDVSADGREIVFDSVREESDVVVIDLE